MKVLVVEDNRDVALMVKEGLSSRSLTVDVAENGADGSFMARTCEYDAIVLDYSLPKKDGFVVCKEVRAANKTTPVIFLSSTDSTETKIAALENGADDYMTKPFSLDELHARIKAVTRRPAQLSQTLLTVGDLTLNTDTHEVTRAGVQIRLTRKEFALLEYLMKHAGTVLSRTTILDHVWTADLDPFSNTVEAHIRNLRKKISPAGKSDMIMNIIGHGYVIDTRENLKKR